MKRICVFAGSSAGARAEYLVAAQKLGQALVRHQIHLVYGGAQVGLMGALADAVLAAGGHVTGVIPESLVAKEIAHVGLSDLRIVASMHERKAAMSTLADGFIAMPGGWGTLEELFEVLTWAQLGMHRKPCGLLNVVGYYDPLVALFDRAVADGFVRPENRAIVVTESDPEALIDRLTVASAGPESGSVRPEEA